MIKITDIRTYGWEEAIRGMRNPMNSWTKSDTYNHNGFLFEEDFNEAKEEGCVPELAKWVQDNPGSGTCDPFCSYVIGDNDLNLMKRLRQAGTDHRKYMRMIAVYCDITAPLYWWSEYDTYKVGTVANSCSKMHKMLAKPFEMSDFSFDKLFGYKRDVKYFTPEVDEDLEVWKKTIEDEYYEVSNYGRVRHDGRILSGSVHDDGYIFINIRGKQYAKHRIVAEAFIPNSEHKPFVNHIDGNKQNCMCSNLEWCTQSENIQHAHDTGLQPKNLSTYKGKFTKEQREEIKKLWDEGCLSKREIAKKYKVSHTCINDIINNKYQYADRVNVFETVARPIVDTLNELRDAWLDENDSDKKKQIWYSILQLLPSSYNQKRTVALNYEVLANMYKSRKNHKLDEWRDFCDWIETLPYSELITGKDE